MSVPSKPASKVMHSTLRKGQSSRLSRFSKSKGLGLERELKTSAHDEYGVEKATDSACSSELSKVLALLQEIHKTRYTNNKRLNFDLWRDMAAVMSSSVGSVLLKHLTIFPAKQGKNGIFNISKRRLSSAFCLCTTTIRPARPRGKCAFTAMDRLRPL